MSCTCAPASSRITSDGRALGQSLLGSSDYLSLSVVWLINQCLNERSPSESWEAVTGYSMLLVEEKEQSRSGLSAHSPSDRGTGKWELASENEIQRVASCSWVHPLWIFLMLRIIGIEQQSSYSQLFRRFSKQNSRWRMNSLFLKIQGLGSFKQ